MTAKPLTAYPEVIQLYLGYHEGLRRMGVPSGEMSDMVEHIGDTGGILFLLFEARPGHVVRFRIGRVPSSLSDEKRFAWVLLIAALRWNDLATPEEEHKAVLDLFRRTVDLPAFVSAVATLIHGPLPVAVAQA